MDLVDAACTVWSMGNRSTSLRERIAVDEVLKSLTKRMPHADRERFRSWAQRQVIHSSFASTE